ncbi:helix-turn-helix domain-containing protein [Halapricum desulfuricans]|uniref:Transcriptional regulator, contains HTH domain n=1 Tax=Halapricum desulfuricans TaxID=2841257 RepID=A0A897NNV5_9EURY|nr:helix-turn-helix domain-containing protein [Halapricum desulfuricans]QSG14447.1 Transcriptional regulator, contains HTH domain [Halapricum desulfuricans]
MSDAPTFTSVASGDAAVSGGHETRDLWVTLKVHVGDDCPLTAIDADVENVDLQQMNGECRATIVSRDDEDLNVLQTHQEMGPDCVSQAFHRHGCIPRIVDTDEGAITVTVYPEERATIPKLVESIRDLGYVLDVERLVGVSPELITDSTVLCDLSILTGKQREAIELAVQRGYYARDGNVNLDAMADELNISSSALSRRLKSAEAKLMLELIDRADGDGC